MNYKKLGSTNVDVSTICLGTMTWGEQNSKADGFEQMDYAIDNGVNFWDTAEIYAIPMREETYGETENIIGEWFKKTKKRDKVILATKVSGPTSKEYIRGGGCSYDKKSMSEALEKSLKRMQTDYIDLYQLHWPERNTNFFGKQGYEHDLNEKNWIAFEEILENLKKFVDAGKIRYVGLSNETAWGLAKCLELSKLKNLPKIFLKDAFIWIKNFDLSDFDFIFLDPPFSANYEEKILKFFSKYNKLKSSCKIYLEHSKFININMPDNFSILKEKNIGDVRAILIQKNDN